MESLKSINNLNDLYNQVVVERNPVIIGTAIFGLVFTIFILIKIRLMRCIKLDTKVLHECTKKGVGLPIDQAFEVIHKELIKHYPQFIAAKRNWLLFNGGGAMGQMCVLHASLSEYLIFYGTPLYSQGHSGRYLMDVYDFMIQGETKQFFPGYFKPINFPAGQYSYLPMMVAKGYCCERESYMLEYGRGIIPLALPYFLCSSIFVTLDIIPWLQAVYFVGWEVTKNLLFRRKI
ncbi:hypothetical protein DICPUDRAFT_155426 [Dictyostelium purpureum]|uniref:C-8 sterol isomerase n=1 Tax=Dictyostelium purpureum TaxID=5786 RepID=F0ZTZ6_DICPU|nr:uncharacterized protein DICPUDRAFT_155426 [Dictyostelium purpureum]EGC32603.1 hypothetical protein DICPUDRAFT_155426 [Dictyostelium purpureum]|eukprot:XP_003290894.1 hypothetical protein DICPUDRAFT_155426 [Dictyostelium purpureum]